MGDKKARERAESAFGEYMTDESHSPMDHFVRLFLREGELHTLPIEHAFEAFDAKFGDLCRGTTEYETLRAAIYGGDL